MNEKRIMKMKSQKQTLRERERKKTPIQRIGHQNNINLKKENEMTTSRF